MNIQFEGCTLGKKGKILYRGLLLEEVDDPTLSIKFIDYKTKKVFERNGSEYSVNTMPRDIYNTQILLLEKAKLDEYISDEDYEYLYGDTNIIDTYPIISTLRQLGFTTEHSLDEIDTTVFKEHILTKIDSIIKMQLEIIDEDSFLSAEELNKIKESMIDTHTKYKTFANTCDNKVELIRNWPSILIYELEYLKYLIIIEERKREIEML